VFSWELIHQGCSALLSFGVAGGLAPGLRAGDVVLAEGVVAGGQTLRSDSAWIGRTREALADELPITVGMLAGVAAPVVTGEEKRRLYAATGAVALDMESHAVAAAARGAGLPFLAIRVIADAATQSVPAWLSGVIDETGAVNLAAFFGGLMAHPLDGVAVCRLAGANRRAMASLRRVAVRLGPGFGLL
jgi:hopanoid-associated phosphorylase